ncbi:hydrolase of the alpha/beta superfamily-like protein [Haloterrigena turkmenica DSM 5511]|uniref:Hydrolase of the alpha/beta superfamily-like protein n=1 Tax=Haloterrigena turkmenica (strain ATCC 51198 / DSM 5511 / JCM 9101 / NCIMB 13204 / VKM B-1734 / 4k) TaxID=543526 RepID=D2RWB7_HALTV|nr:alpha/beta family hydrolase [Haloterrigena turkmenica]ADB59506.1 hydrolase of the alpha/beta superfamily-like protein [Haloterrigena turkmenica DSM 5511]
MSDVLIPGGRDVRGTLAEPIDDPDAIVVAAPPHPQHSGSRSDPRLTAVAESLRESDIACLRFDYGAWDEGYGEREDVRNAVRWAREEYGRGDGTADGDDRPVGVFGYSFGASLALLAAADVDPDAVAALAPTARLADDLDAVDALESLELPVCVLYGERDETVDWEPVVDRARERGDAVTALAGDHFFLGTHGDIGDEVAGFFEKALLESA